ncbi:hypothetical protein K449DRAFT_401464 [Hypoxylon sp. EC38]|nr:hypothetical protein K449DRAFT_401464 [Hypoxylon sp. EC38]
MKLLGAIGLLLVLPYWNRALRDHRDSIDSLVTEYHEIYQLHLDSIKLYSVHILNNYRKFLHPIIDQHKFVNDIPRLYVIEFQSSSTSTLTSQTTTQASQTPTQNADPTTTSTTSEGAIITYTIWPPNAVIEPVTTSVDKPKPADNGVVVPCHLWFISLCVQPDNIKIGGWKFKLPPGVYPPGPPPPPALRLPSPLTIRGTLPPWPKVAIGNDKLPTYSAEPTQCETKTAYLCATTESIGPSTTETASSCEKIIGCNVQDSDSTKTNSCTASKVTSFLVSCSTGSATSSCTTVTSSVIPGCSLTGSTSSTIASCARVSTQMIAIEEVPPITASVTRVASNIRSGSITGSATNSTSKAETTTTATSSTSHTDSKISVSKTSSTTLSSAISLTPSSSSSFSSSSSSSSSSSLITVRTPASPPPPPPKTPLERQAIVCHKESDFPGHADVNGHAQDDFSATFGSKGGDSLELGPGSDPVVYHTKDGHGISYQYEAAWIKGCVTTVDRQSFRWPIGSPSEITAYLLVREDFTKCNNGGVGGSTQVGCLSNIEGSTEGSLDVEVVGSSGGEIRDNVPKQRKPNTETR